METIVNDITGKLVKGLKKAATELEEFQLQFSLGKAEAADKYEDLKKKFSEVIHKAKLKVKAGKENGKALKAKFEELHVQLALGKAETKDAFMEQKKKINTAISEIENSIKHTDLPDDLYDSLKHEMEKFKIKLEMLHVQYELGKAEMKDAFQDKKKDFARMLSELKMKFAKHENKEGNWEHFRSEMHEAYDHLKKAFVR